MQDDSGLKRVLSFSWAYSSYQRLIGADGAMRWVAEHHWKARPGQKIVDIGCGPGTTIRYLPEKVRYIGIDISDAYIDSAKRSFGGNADFICGTAGDFLAKPDERLLNADLVMCNGLLHHLDDRECDQVLQLSRRILSATGRLAVFEPTYLAHQTRFSRWMADRDRGRNVRLEEEWKRLLGRTFPHVTTRVLTGLIRIPFNHIAAECTIEDIGSNAG